MCDIDTRNAFDYNDTFTDISDIYTWIIQYVQIRIII